MHVEQAQTAVPTPKVGAQRRRSSLLDSIQDAREERRRDVGGDGGRDEEW